ncbi:MAG: heme-binding domain-containing protein [Acidobacteriia bacterium]|nr:heme-binding domain-containing protein [Terriglobia bacterium]
MRNETELHDLQKPSLSRKTARLRIALLSLGVLWMLATGFVHPLPHTISERATSPLFPGARITPSVAQAFNRACGNCHSEKTEWPWYAQVAPGSWLVESDVKRARKRMNLSRWENVDPTDQRLLLSAIATVVENREMPPRRYLMLHPKAKLTADESVEVIEWTRTERRRLRESTDGAATQ